VEIQRTLDLDYGYWTAVRSSKEPDPAKPDQQYAVADPYQPQVLYRYFCYLGNAI
jgi:hypothetical protein